MVRVAEHRRLQKLEFLAILLHQLKLLWGNLVLILTSFVCHFSAVTFLNFSIIEVFMEKELREEIVLWEIISQVRNIEDLLVDLVRQLNFVFSLNKYFCEVRYGNLFECFITFTGVIASRDVWDRVVIVTLDVDFELLFVIYISISYVLVDHGFLVCCLESQLIMHKLVLQPDGCNNFPA